MFACYNAMITSLLIKLNFTDIEKINTGIHWIINFQNVKKGEKCDWHSNIMKNKVWVGFDKSRRKGLWISNEIEKLV